MGASPHTPRPAALYQLPHKLVYKTHEKVRTLTFRQFWDWSYKIGGLITRFRHTNATYPYFVWVFDLFCIALTVFNYYNLLYLMTKCPNLVQSQRQLPNHVIIHTVIEY